jgi:hypothetical protein
MNDAKNILLAWTSTVTTLFAAIESRTLMTVISAIVMPVIFFAVGKAVDVAVQIYLKKERK